MLDESPCILCGYIYIYGLCGSKDFLFYVSLTPIEKIRVSNIPFRKFLILISNYVDRYPTTYIKSIYFTC
jgi:hypothetical protein